MNKNNSVKLAVENKKMEDRLRVLREMMSAEKSRRELDGGVYWKSGQSGSLSTSKQLPRPAEMKNPAQDKKRPIKVRILTDKNGSSERKLPQCGQCEKSSASLNCVECIENYCQVCFARIHQKGGLAKHHVKPILQKIKHVTPPEKSNIPAKSSSPLEEKKIRGGAEPLSLLEGTYDEAQSAKSFQEALADWRSEKSKSCKESGTHNLRESFTCTTSEMLTGTNDMAEGHRKLNVEFTDKNQVTYFEKLLMKKYKDGSMTNPQPVEAVASTGTADNNEPTADDKSTPTISQYNIFYDADMELEGENEALVIQEVVPDIQTVGDLTKCRSSTVSIEEFNSSAINLFVDGEDKVGTENTEEVVTMHNGVDTGPRDEGCKDEKPQAVDSSSHDVDGNFCAEMLEGQTPSPYPNSTHNLQKSDILASVKSAWTNCAQSSHGGQELVHFFLHGVDPLDGELEEESTMLPKPQLTKISDGSSNSDPHQFKLASSLWLPSNSTSLVEPEVNIDITPPSSRPDTTERKDRYYDDTDTDSEPENEREEFISSRLGMTNDSMEMQLRQPSTSHYRDFEEEDRMEQDRADSAALDELAWELTSTVECEGRLSRCEQDFDGSAVTPAPAMDEEREGEEEEEEPEGNIEVGEVDMTKAISEFELFQKSLMEEDSL